jgi:RsiW-degrading membrane proteinase PrsW (M82 family)
LEAFVEAARRERSGGSLTTLPVEPGQGRTLAGPEWWERLTAHWIAWWQRHQRLAVGWARLRTITLWVALPALLLVFVLYPEFRTGLRIWLCLYALLVAWFVVARTKTVSWRLVAGLFATSVWWSVVIATVSIWLSGRASGVRADGPGIVIAGMTEESLKLVPLALLAVAAPGRVRRFAVVDWLLLGFASGLGFQAFEELARRTSLAVMRPGLLNILDRLLAGISGADPYGPGSGYPQYGLGLLAGGSGTALAGYAGHHVLTALVAVTVGLAVAGWRRSTRRAPAPVGAGIGWRVVAVVAPLAAWWLVVADHAGFNATARISSRAWTETSDAPRLLRVTWELSGHGFGRGWLLLVLLLVALLVDARHLRRGEIALSEQGEATSGSAPRITDSPGLLADRWAVRLAIWQAYGPRAASSPAVLAMAARWATATTAAACALAAYMVRDVLVLIGAHARQPDETRLEAIARGRLAMGELHDQRASQIAAVAPADTTRRRLRSRGMALGGLAVLLVAGLLLAPTLASQLGPSLTTAPFGWLAGASGAATYLLDYSHGLAAFSRDPATATRRYLATTTPQGAIVDLGEFAVTFAPGNLAGAAGGRFTRQAVLRTVGLQGQPGPARRRQVRDPHRRHHPEPAQ